MWNYYTDRPGAKQVYFKRRQILKAIMLTILSCHSYTGARKGKSGKEPRFRGRSIFGLPLFNPLGSFYNGWSVFMTLVDLTYTAFMVPISVAFDKVQGGAGFTWINIVDIVGSSFYIGDIFMEFSTGFEVELDLQRQLVMNGRHVAQFYIFHGGFLVDLIATLPVIPEILLASMAVDASQGVKIVYAIRLLRLVRVIRFLKAVFGTDLFRNTFGRTLLQFMSAPLLYLTSLLLAVVIIVNILACIMIFIAELEGEENSWMAYASFKFDVAQAGGVQQWVVATYWAAQTLTTVGYGDVVAVTIPEALVASLFMLIAIIIFGLLVSIIGETVTVSSLSAWRGRQLRTQLQSVEAWGKERHLGTRIMEKIRRYYIDLWAPHAGFDDVAQFEALPIMLRGEIVNKFAGNLMRASHLFAHLQEKSLVNLMCYAKPLRLVAGHNLYVELEEGSSFFVLQQGETAVYQGVHYVRSFHGPSILGQRALFGSYIPQCKIRFETVRAQTNCTLWVFEDADIYRITRHDPEMLLHFCTAYLAFLDMQWEKLKSFPSALEQFGVPQLQKLVCRLAKKAAKQADATRREPNLGHERPPSPDADEQLPMEVGFEQDSIGSQTGNKIGTVIPPRAQEMHGHQEQNRDGSSSDEPDLDHITLAHQLSFAHPGFTHEATSGLPRQSMFRWKTAEEV